MTHLGANFVQTEGAIDFLARHLGSRGNDGSTPLEKLLQLELKELKERHLRRQLAHANEKLAELRMRMTAAETETARANHERDEARRAYQLCFKPNMSRGLGITI